MVVPYKDGHSKDMCVIPGDITFPRCVKHMFKKAQEGQSRLKEEGPKSP